MSEAAFNGETFNLYAEWGDILQEIDGTLAPPKKCSIVLLSTWNLNLPPGSQSKFLTNLVAGGVIAQRTNMVSSNKLPHHSVFYCNPDRDVSLMAGNTVTERASNAQARTTLKNTADLEIAATESLLDLYKIR